MQRCKNAQNLMESNGGKTKMISSGTSIAFQRAKEHPNQSSKVGDMVKTVKWCWLFLGGPCARGQRAVGTGSRAHGTSVVGTGCPGTSRGPVGTSSGARRHRGGGKFAISTPNSKGKKKN